MQLNKLHTGNLTGNIKQPESVSFGSYISMPYAPSKDTFVRQSTSTLPYTTQNVTTEHLISPHEVADIINKYVNAETVQQAVSKNPNIAYVLNTFGLQPVVSEKNIDNALKYHLGTTAAFALEIAKREHLSVQDTNTLVMSAALHDIGKALIPETILQKPGKLTPQEKEIVDLHSFLGAQILKTTDVPIEVIDIVANHHSPENPEAPNPATTILTISDVFSALKEKRAYKDAFTDEQAFSHLYQRTALNHRYIRHLELYRANY